MHIITDLTKSFPRHKSPSPEGRSDNPRSLRFLGARYHTQIPRPILKFPMAREPLRKNRSANQSRGPRKGPGRNGGVRVSSRRHPRGDWDRAARGRARLYCHTRPRAAARTHVAGPPPLLSHFPRAEMRRPMKTRPADVGRPASLRGRDTCVFERRRGTFGNRAGFGAVQWCGL